MTVLAAEMIALPVGTVADRASLREVFQSLGPDSCPFHYNFHFHTTHSDGRLSPNDVLEQAIAIGLRGLAVSDHHSVGGYWALKRLLAARQASQPQTRLPRLWSGVEITATLLEGTVHILGYAFDAMAPCLAPYLTGQEPTGDSQSAARVIEAIHQAGGLAVLAHPMRYRQSVQDLIPAAVELGIDGVETYYAYGNPMPWQTSPEQTAQVKQLSDRFGLLNTCGTDTHGPNLLQRL